MTAPLIQALDELMIFYDSDAEPEVRVHPRIMKQIRLEVRECGGVIMVDPKNLNRVHLGIWGCAIVSDPNVWISIVERKPS